jgi:hypothetical protein
LRDAEDAGAEILGQRGRRCKTSRVSTEEASGDPGEFQQALDLQPNYLPALYALGVAYMTAGDGLEGGFNPGTAPEADAQ